MFKRLCSTALIFGAAALAPPQPAAAQGLSCLPRDALVERLEGRYREHLAGGGLQNAQQLLEVWTSAETGTFTVFITRPDGVSCIVATGQHWNEATQTRLDGVAG
ncbi:hypothetical protein SAMN04487859_102208 [Roseovarius lutimaris]|uniref:Peptidase propeptide and YPEB domain-containing protein n=1 Tax=Roseovarius lutimaris TaxID=1005928 RepID=A0A1I4Z0R2_9RHOB|nr:hypothetical protein [Roseovarius lutimaris]SFN43855.1 hypothetical protein SAMN04487859_102208 [Roseovarius lutimaris]